MPKLGTAAPVASGNGARKRGVVPNRVEHALLLLVVLELGILYGIRRSFSSAQGG